MLKRIQAKRKKAVLTYVGMMALALVVVISVFYLVRLKNFWTSVHIPAGAAAKKVQDTPKEEKTSFNVLLMGYAGGQRAGGSLTDTMIVAHIDITDRSLVLLSVPRDLWVAIPTTERGEEFYGKINSAYPIGLSDRSYPNKPAKYRGEGGGGAMAKDVVASVLGLPIDYYVAVDFDSFISIIDAIGGLDVELEKTLDDREYPLEGHEDDTCEIPEEELVDVDEKLATISARELFPCRYEHIYFPAGKVNLNGSDALKVVRSRHGIYDGSDFGRADRQQRVILAVKDKVFSLSFLTKLPALLDELQDRIRTDIPADLVTKFLGQAKNFNDFQIRNLVLSDKNFLKSNYSSDGQYILVPRNGSFVHIQEWAATLISIPTNNFPTIRIENGTTKEGLGSTAQVRLKALGLNVGSVGNSTATESAKLTTLKVYKKNVDENVLKALEDEFSTIAKMSEASHDASHDVLILIGEDYQKHILKP